MNKNTQNPSSGVYFVTISTQQVGQRIDNFLVTLLKGVPKSRIYRAVRKGEVRVNKGRIKPEYRLKLDDLVRIPPVQDEEAFSSGEKTIPDRLAKVFEESILYEDDDVIVLNKPAKLAVHSGSGIDFGIIDMAQRFHPQGKDLQLVHRLDRDTSGCLLLSKSRQALLPLQEMLRENTMTKIYLALTMGQWRQSETKIDAPLQKNSCPTGERMVRVDEEGKEAVTIFTVKQNYPDASLMEIQLLSGRTHQIRVHAQYAHHPVAGDEKYGDFGFNKKMREFGLKRLFLHAYTIKFKSPSTQKEISITAPIPEALQEVLYNMEKEA